MHRNGYNTVQLDGLNASMIKHQKMNEPAPDPQSENEKELTPMWPSERIDTWRQWSLSYNQSRVQQRDCGSAKA